MDGTEGQKGSLLGGTQGQTSEAKAQGTSENQPKTYTEEEVRKLISDALAKAGRDAKSLKQLEESLKAEREEIAKWREEKEKAELEAAKDNPEELSLIQRTQALRKREAELAEREAAFAAAKAAYEDEIKTAREVLREIAIFDAAGEDIDPGRLKDLCDKLDAQTEEQIRAIADSIRPEKKPSAEARQGMRTSLKVDSGVTTGVVPGDSPREKVLRGLEKLQKK